MKQKDSCLIKNLWIRDDKQGQGYFSKFFNDIKKIARNKKCKCITVSVAKDNKNAIDIYTHFKACIVEEKHYSDMDDMFFMKIDLCYDNEKYRSK